MRRWIGKIFDDKPATQEWVVWGDDKSFESPSLASSSLPPSSLPSPPSSLRTFNRSLAPSLCSSFLSRDPSRGAQKSIKVLRFSENEGEDGKTCLDSSAPFAASEANPGIDFYTESMAFCQQRETSPAMCRKEGSDGALGEGRDAPVLSLFDSLVLSFSFLDQTQREVSLLHRLL